MAVPTKVGFYWYRWLGSTWAVAEVSARYPDPKTLDVGLFSGARDTVQGLSTTGIEWGPRIEPPEETDTE